MNLHSLGLPALHARPSAEILLSTLDSLTLRPLAFHSSFMQPAPMNLIEDIAVYHKNTDSVGIARYLTSIISSPLAWIPFESLREQIWEAASTRLSERAGRTAMPSMTREFVIPISKSTCSTPAATSAASTATTTVTQFQAPSSLKIALHEPSLTADNLGHKTWASSFVLAQRLSDLAPYLLSHNLCPPSQDEPEEKAATTQLRVLELGAGTGLLGLAFASLFPNTHIALTDLPAITPNLACNLHENAALLERIGSTGEAFALDWATVSPSTPQGDKYDIILVADPIYSPEHPKLVVGAVEACLKRGKEAMLLVGLPVREAYRREREELWRRLRGLGLEILRDGREMGVDDWEDGRGERVQVECLWGLWRWQEGR